MRAGGLVGLAVALALALGAAPASAQQLPQGGLTAGEVAAWLKRGGAPAELAPDTTTPGDQMVTTLTDGVYLFNCDGEGDARRCRSIQYATGWAPRAGLTIEKANAWNASNRYIKAYVTEKGSLFGEYDVDISPGGSYEMLDASFETWRATLARFKKFFAG